MNLLTKQEGLNYRLEGRHLHLEPPVPVRNCSWSIFDISGTEKCNGRFLSDAESVIDITCLAPGVYEVCLMDGEKLRTARFRLN
jgi:hypothetical protein